MYPLIDANAIEIAPCLPKTLNRQYGKMGIVTLSDRVSRQRMSQAITSGHMLGCAESTDNSAKVGALDQRAALQP